MPEVGSNIYIDRNPLAFDIVLDYLRNECSLGSDIPDDLVNYVGADADYFGLVGLKKACDNHILQKKNESNEALRQKTAGAKKKKEYEIVDANSYFPQGMHREWQIEAVIPEIADLARGIDRLGGSVVLWKDEE